MKNSIKFPDIGQRRIKIIQRWDNIVVQIVNNIYVDEEVELTKGEAVRLASELLALATKEEE